MTSPRHAESTAIGRYYTHPVTEQRLISVTNVLSVAMAKPALVPWAAKIVAEHALNNLPAVVAGSRTDRDGTLRALKQQVTVVRDKAADLGTRIHALADAHVTGRELAWEDGDDEAAPFVEQYLAFLTDFGIELDRDIVAAELTVAHPTLGYAGTLDLIVELPLGVEWTDQGPKTYALPDGERAPWMVDLKTSTTRDSTSIYPEYALQLTALRKAREMWMPDDTTLAIERGVVGTAVLNLRSRTYALIPVPSGDTEWAAFRGALTEALWVHSEPVAACRPVNPDGRLIPKQTRTRKAAVKKTAATKPASRKVA